MYQFTKELETGNAAIDSQHRQLFDAFNQILDACSQGKGRNVIRSALSFLQDYTAKHFGDEEDLQNKYNYTDRVNHKVYHETFKATIRDIMSEYEQTGPTVLLVGKINTNLVEWFINHIKKEDVKVAAHIKNVSKA